MSAIGALVVLAVVDYFLARHRATDMCEQLSVGVPESRIREIQAAPASLAGLVGMFPVTSVMMNPESRTTRGYFSTVFTGVHFAKFTCAVELLNGKVKKATVRRGFDYAIGRVATIRMTVCSFPEDSVASNSTNVCVPPK
jgi:hypothetical protein